ncbi:MFS transporter [Paenibacillus wynnii]|uniref:MFS transporter n=1 Tax=Paenibacillus wynnii TaxID=268407 RepID=A0A098MEI1_9BACL|nr:MFS transporter [Paenibacillus wynnii]KGE20954.1 MFS transporter [Paenibacillus wynnii]
MPTDTSEQVSRNPLRSFAVPFASSPAFLFLWLGHLISFLGSSVTMVILPVLVYSLTGSTTTMGFVMATYMLPNILMLPISGHIVDRYDRVKIMMIADIARFFIMLAIALLSLSGLLSIPLLFLFVGLYGLIDGLFQPAYAAVRATVFTPDIRVAANSLTQMTTQAVRLIGPALGGLLITHWSAGIGFGIDAFTYVLSLICLIYLRRRIIHSLRRPSSSNIQPEALSPAEAPSVLETSQTLPSTHWRDDFREGIAVLRSHPWLWITILAFSFINICYSGIISVLIPWLFKVHHGWDPYLYGLAVTFSGVGAIIGGLLFGMRSSWKHRGIMAYGGAFISGVALMAVAFVPSAGWTIALFALEGFGIMIFGLIWEISLQELVPQEAFGRVASLDMLGSFALLPIGYIAVGWLADLIGGVATISICAGVGMATVAFVLSIPAIHKFQ